MRQIVLDTETTGLEVEKGHRIIELGCVELVKP
jgi:DNA polymerase III subunit epsilon